MKFNCEKCGKIDEALFDGYEFGDRILEGVKFKARKNDNGTCEVESVDIWENDPYLKGLNKEFWLNNAKQFAEKNDIFICPNCRRQVVPDDMLA